MSGGEVDLVVAGGTVVGPRARARADVWIDGGRVAHVGPAALTARTRIDAEGLLVLPGMVDAHVHLMEPGDGSRETLSAGTARPPRRA